MDDLRDLEATLGLSFSDYSLLTRALTHRSYLNEHPGSILEDNERLEFLGDAVLDFVTASYLYNRFPEMSEGELTALRAALVRTGTLASFARRLNLGLYLRLGLGEAESGGRDRRATLCAAFEALVGAIYLDQGLERVREFVLPLVVPALQEIQERSLHKDAKSEFQVWAQAEHNLTPYYRVIESAGPDHAKLFTVQAMLGDDVWGEGQGSSKQAAAQAAAGAAMARVLDD